MRRLLVAAAVAWVVLLAAPAAEAAGPTTWFPTSASNTYIDQSEAVWYAASAYNRFNAQANAAGAYKRFAFYKRVASDRAYVRYWGPWPTTWLYYVNMDLNRPGYGAPAVFVTEDP